VLNRGMSKKIIVGFFLSLFLFSCSIFQSTNAPMEISVKGDHFSLAWDDASWSISNNLGKPAAYRVYYRNHGGSSWKILHEISASAETTELTVTKGDLIYGLYDFGVSALDASGVESKIHSSMDTTADPVCGWYIDWIGSK
jgi:hypothetical protein